MCALPEGIPSRMCMMRWQVALPVVDSAAGGNGRVVTASCCLGLAWVMHHVSIAGCGGER